MIVKINFSSHFLLSKLFITNLSLCCLEKCMYCVNGNWLLIINNWLLKLIFLRNFTLKVIQHKLKHMLFSFHECMYCVNGNWLLIMDNWLLKFIFLHIFFLSKLFITNLSVCHFEKCMYCVNGNWLLIIDNLLLKFIFFAILLSKLFITNLSVNFL